MPQNRFFLLIACVVLAAPALYGRPLFKPAQTYDAGPSPDRIAVADVNGDGKPDLLIANGCLSATDCQHGGMSVLLGNGDGSFQAPQTYFSGGTNPLTIAVVDLNGDGKLDVAMQHQCVNFDNCANGPANGGAGVLFGNGDGTFQAAKSYNTQGYVGQAIAIADVNGDHKPDLVVTDVCNGPLDCSDGGVVGVLLNKGNGTFKSVQLYPSGGYAAMGVAVGDVNGDGKPDVMVANDGSSSCTTPASAGVLLGNGDGTLQPVQVFNAGGCYARALAVADVNGDGKLDMAVVNPCQNFHCAKGQVGVLLGNGNGSFQAVQTNKSLGYNTNWAALGDVDMDGKPDLINANSCYSKTTCNTGGRVGVRLNNGDGTFRALSSLYSGGVFATAVAIADVNGDSKADVVVVNNCTSQSNCSEGAVGVLLNNR